MQWLREDRAQKPLTSEVGLQKKAKEKVGTRIPNPITVSATVIVVIINYNTYNYDTSWPASSINSG